MPPRCFLGCPSAFGRNLHVFPNPERFPEQFYQWVNIVGGQINSLEDYNFYRSKRLCDRHFTAKDRNRNNRLNALAVPSLFLRSSGPLMEIDMNIPLLQATSLVDSLTECLTGKSVPCQEDPVASTSTTINCWDLKRAESIMSSTSSAMDNTLIETSNTLRKITDAATSLFLEHNYCKVEHQKTYNVAALDLRNKMLVQRQIRGLERQIKMLRKRSIGFKNRLETASKMSVDIAFQKIAKKMTTPAKIFTRMQFSQTNKKPSGRRFSLEEKVLSLSLYKRSPKCYALLAHCFTLPSKKTLKGLLAKIKLGPGINEKIFEKISKTVKDMRHKKDRLCTIIFDEMSLTPQISFDMANDRLRGFVSSSEKKNLIADHALVFMIKGIRARFKQPVAYYFTNSLTKVELMKIIVQVIERVQATGLKVICSVCDQSSVNVGAITALVHKAKSKHLREGKEWRYDFYEVNNTKIVPLYDVPHLLKGLRNNILTKDLLYIDADDDNQQKIVKWQYFKDIYDADTTRGELRLLHKITEEHINPEKIKKMRVKLAAQIFSHSVAVVADHLTARGILNEDCRQVIPIVSLVNNLFDSLNCSSFHIPNGKIYKGCVKKSSPHHELWTKAKIMLKSMKFIHKKKVGNEIRLITSIVPTTINFIKTIEGFEALWSILSKKYAFDCMLTRSFNQDPVENFFGNIRSYGARNTSPNVISFEGAFKSLLLNNFNSPHSINANCEQDDNTCLQSLDFFITEIQDAGNNVDISEEILEINEEVLFDREIEEDLGQRNYVCGWVLKKCLKNVVKGCVTCKLYLLCNTENENNVYIRHKEYNKKKKWLVYPSMEIVAYFFEIQKNTNIFLKRNVPHISLKSKIKWITDMLNDFPCNCATHKNKLKEYFIDTTINILINSWCRDVNRILSGKVSYNGDDDVKNEAKMYYNKHRIRK